MRNPGLGHRCGQPEAGIPTATGDVAQPPVGAVHRVPGGGHEPGTELDGIRHVRESAEHDAGALTRRDGDGGTGDAGKRPGHLHIQRGGFPNHGPHQAIPLLLQHDAQLEDRLAPSLVILGQVEHGERAKPVKQPLGQGAEPASAHREHPQVTQTTEDVPGQAAESAPPQRQLLHGVQIVEHAGGQGRQPRVAQVQVRQRGQPVEVPDPDGVDGLTVQPQPGDPAQVGRGDHGTVEDVINRIGPGFLRAPE